MKNSPQPEIHVLIHLMPPHATLFYSPGNKSTVVHSGSTDIFALRIGDIC
jgi:hypothetical protein